MILHGHTPRDLLASTTKYITKDMRASLCKSDNYRGISLFNSICNVFDTILYIHLKCNLDLNKIISLFCAV